MIGYLPLIPIIVVVSLALYLNHRDRALRRGKWGEGEK